MAEEYAPCMRVCGAHEGIERERNPPIPLPNNPSANGGLKLTHPVLATESPGLVPEGVSQSA